MSPNYRWSSSTRPKTPPTLSTGRPSRLGKIGANRCRMLPDTVWGINHLVWPLRLPLQLPLHLHKHCVTITFAITITRWQPHERVNHQVWPDWPLTECINVNMHNSCIVESLHSWINVMHSWLHNLCLGPFELSRKHHQRHNYRDIRPCATVHI